MTPEVKERIEQIRHGIVPDGYKMTKMGIAPKEWEEVCFGDIYTERREPGNENLPMLMVSIHSGVSDGEVDEEDLPKKVKRIEDKSQYKRAASGDLVFNMMRAWQGAIGSVRTEGMVSPAYIVATPNEMVAPLFMDYSVKTARMIYTINKQSYGVTDFRKRLYWDSFAPIICVLPTLSEQREIAKILTAQDRVIELKEKLLAEKQQQKKYFMQQLMTGKNRLPGFSGMWRKKYFNEIFVFGTTNTFSREHMKNDENGIKNIHYGDVLTRYGEILDVSRTNIPTLQPDVKTESFPALQNGDLVIADTAEDYIVGKASEIAGITDEVVLSGLHTMLCRPKPGMFASGWLGFFINSTQYHDQLRPLIAGAKVMSISKKNIEKTYIEIPPLDEQIAIVDVLKTANKGLKLIRQDIEQEKQKKKALMQLLLTGIVRV